MDTERMRLARLLSTLLLVSLCGALALAQGVRLDQLTTDDLLRLYDNAVALEVEVPQGATTFSVAYGPAGKPNGLGSSLRAGPSPRPSALRVVALLPDPSVVDPCAAEESEVTLLVVRQYGDAEGTHHRQKVCVPHPSKSSITGSVTRVPQRDALALDEWTPLLVQAWLVRDGEDDSGAIDSALDLNHAFVLQLHFGSQDSASYPTTKSLTVEELAAIPAVAELVEEYGLPDAR